MEGEMAASSSNSRKIAESLYKKKEKRSYARLFEFTLAIARAKDL